MLNCQWSVTPEKLLDYVSFKGNEYICPLPKIETRRNKYLFRYYRHNLILLHVARHRWSVILLQRCFHRNRNAVAFACRVEVHIKSTAIEIILFFFPLPAERYIFLYRPICYIDLPFDLPLARYFDLAHLYSPRLYSIREIVRSILLPSCWISKQHSLAAWDLCILYDFIGNYADGADERKTYTISPRW